MDAKTPAGPETLYFARYAKKIVAIPHS